MVNNLQEVLGISTNPAAEIQNTADEKPGSKTLKTDSDYFCIKKTYLMGIILFIILLLLLMFRKTLKSLILRTKE